MVEVINYLGRAAAAVQAARARPSRRRRGRRAPARTSARAPRRARRRRGAGARRGRRGPSTSASASPASSSGSTSQPVSPASTMCAGPWRSTAMARQAAGHPLDEHEPNCSRTEASTAASDAPRKSGSTSCACQPARKTWRAPRRPDRVEGVLALPLPGKPPSEHERRPAGERAWARAKARTSRPDALDRREAPDGQRTGARGRTSTSSAVVAHATPPRRPAASRAARRRGGGASGRRGRRGGGANVGVEAVGARRRSAPGSGRSSVAARLELVGRQEQQPLAARRPAPQAPQPGLGVRPAVVRPRRSPRA